MNSMKNYFHSVTKFVAEICTSQDGELHFYLMMCIILITMSEDYGLQTDGKKI